MGRKLADFPSVSDALMASAVIRSAAIVLGDFAETIDLADRGDFLYVDPPYHRISKRDRGEYGPQAMKDSELGRLIESVLTASDRGVKILFSYNVELDHVLSGWRKILVRGRYVIGANAHGRHLTSEYIYCNY
jgi:DNA adenine methylase